MAQAAYGSRADWIASADTSAYGTDGQIDLAAAEDVPGITDPSLPQLSSAGLSNQQTSLTWQATSDRNGNLSWHAVSQNDTSGPHLVLRDVPDLEKSDVGPDDLPPIDITSAPAITNRDVVTILDLVSRRSRVLAASHRRRPLKGVTEND